MKSPKYSTVYYIAVLAICILVMLCWNVMSIDLIPAIGKYTLICLIVAGGSSLIAYLLYEYENAIQKDGTVIVEQQRTEIIKLQEESKRLKIALTDKANEIKQLTAKKDMMQNQQELPQSDEMNSLRERCETVENFRNSFPCEISDQYTIYNIMRTELNVSAFSRWKIVGRYENQLWELNVLRPDSQSYKEMLCLVSATKAPGQLQELDLSKQLLWN
ncbi:hypothetical protein [Massiliimalia massiliensis]|uniref:hypothetical protein n=1 Tax=Massiliimalia massiliensis TaxID=1852384 RepID=UPI000986DAF7|nr:hypothetical protein [Massiliimalia massiliensis]